jgi:hypothetical protein
VRPGALSKTENPRRDAWGSWLPRMGIRDAAAGCRGDGDHRVGLTNANLAAKPPTSTVRSCLAGISMTMSSIRSYNADRDGFDQRCCRSGGKSTGSARFAYESSFRI